MHPALLHGPYAVRPRAMDVGFVQVGVELHTEAPRRGRSMIQRWAPAVMRVVTPLLTLMAWSQSSLAAQESRPVRAGDR